MAQQCIYGKKIDWRILTSKTLSVDEKQNGRSMLFATTNTRNNLSASHVIALNFDILLPSVFVIKNTRGLRVKYIRVTCGFLMYRFPPERILIAGFGFQTAERKTDVCRSSGCINNDGIYYFKEKSALHARYAVKDFKEATTWVNMWKHTRLNKKQKQMEVEWRSNQLLMVVWMMDINQNETSHQWNGFRYIFTMNLGAAFQWMDVADRTALLNKKTLCRNAVR